jgi:hypothetical protein
MLCTNPRTSILASNLVNFFFPIGDRTITDGIMSSATPYNIYVSFQLSVLDTQGKIVISSLFAKAPVLPNTLTKSCESLSAQTSLLSTTKVDIAVGIAGKQADWNSSVSVYKVGMFFFATCYHLRARTLPSEVHLQNPHTHTCTPQDITQAGQAQGGLVDTTANVTAKSIPSGLITVAVKGNGGIFNRQSASSFYIDIEQLSTMHFLDSGRFDTVMGLIRSNTAYSVVTNPSTGRPHIEFTSATRQACGTTGLSCVLYNNIYNKLVNRAAAVHPLATGINTTSLTGTRDWLTANVLRSTDEFSTELAANMTALVRSNFGINDRINRAWFINPGNRWNVPLTGGAQSSLLLTDKLILFAVITLNDGSGNILRRRLLSFSPGGGGGGGGASLEGTLHDDREMAVQAPGRGRGLLQISPSPIQQQAVSVNGDVPSIQSDDAVISEALKKITQVRGKYHSFCQNRAYMHTAHTHTNKKTGTQGRNTAAH